MSWSGTTLAIAVSALGIKCVYADGPGMDKPKSEGRSRRLNPLRKLAQIAHFGRKGVAAETLRKFSNLYSLTPARSRIL
jgi:hypothetical protein